MPRAVAIMPTADRAAYITLSVYCFAKQTIDNKLLIVVDNGVTPVEDGLLAHFLAPEQYIYHRIDPTQRKLNHGAMMNQCASLASPGDVLFAWDDDDWYAPTRMQTQLATLASTGKSVTGYYNLLYYSENDGLTYRYDYAVKPPVYASGSSQCFTHEFWSHYKFMDKPRGADGDFSRRAKELNELAATPGLDMLVARAHGGNTWAVPLGSRQFPPYSREHFPKAFFEDLLREYGSLPVKIAEPRALIAITTSHATAGRRSYQTAWRSRIPAHFDYRYFIGEPQTIIDEDVITLPVPDSYANLTLKTLGIVSYAYDAGYTHVFKCDDDTFIVPDRLVVPDCDYTGHCRVNPPHNDGIDYCHGGRGYWLSRKAMKAILDAPVSLFSSGKIEDGAVAKALKLVGITPVHDDRYTAEPHAFPTRSNDAISCHTLTPAFMTGLGRILTS
jgi:hypothetical protein